jgi:hypothetical protein
MARAASEAGITSPATLVVGEVVDAIPLQQMGELVAGAADRPVVSDVVESAGLRTGTEEVGR